MLYTYAYILHCYMFGRGRSILCGAQAVSCYKLRGVLVIEFVCHFVCAFCNLYVGEPLPHFGAFGRISELVCKSSNRLELVFICKFMQCEKEIYHEMAASISLIDLK